MRDEKTDSPLWLGLLLCASLYAVLGAGPAILSVRVNPWLGLAAAVAAIPTWILLGPRPVPGFLPGILAVGGLSGLFALMVMALIRAIAGL